MKVLEPVYEDISAGVRGVLVPGYEGYYYRGTRGIRAGVRGY